MELLPIWAVWLALGVALLIAEIFTATFFLLCFGVAAIITAAVTWLGFGEPVQFSVFLVTSTVFVVFARSFAVRFTAEPERRAGVDRFIGERAVVIERVDPMAGSGRVRVLHEEWRVDSAAGQCFEQGETVLVTGVKGTHLVIDRVASAETEEVSA